MDQSLASGIYGLGATSFQINANAAESTKARQFTIDMYDKQRADNLADIADARSYYQNMLADERAYNSSAAQVARLKAAGLNPALAYGGQVTTAAPSGGFTSSTPQPAQISQTPFPQISVPDFAGTYLNSQKVKNESMLAKADVILKAAQSHVLDEQTAGTFLDNLFKSSTLDDRIELVTVSLDQANQNIKQTQLVNKTYQNEIDAFPLKIEQLKADIESIRADTSLTEDKRAKLIAETSLTYQKTLTEEIDRIGKGIENDIKSQHLSQEDYKTEMQKVTYWVDTANQCVDSVTGIIDSVTGGVGKFFSGIFNRNRSKTVAYDSETRRMDAVTHRMNSSEPSKPRVRASRRNY